MRDPSLCRAWRLRLALAVVVLCAAGLPAPDALGAMRYGDITVSAEAPAHDETVHGYVEYAITITNHSAARSRRVGLRFPAHESGHGHCIRRMTRTVTVGPSSTVRVSLFQPPLPLYAGGYGAGMAVFIDGRRQRELIELSVGSGFSGSADGVVAYVSRNVDGAFENTARRALVSAGSSRRYSSYSHSPAELKFIRSESPVEAWSTSWLAYSSYDGVVMTGGELLGMPPAARSALWRYVECGGTLLVLGSATVPETWRSRSTVAAGLMTTCVGFGQCIECVETEVGLWDEERWKRVNSAWWATLQPFRSTRSIEDANDAFPVVEGLRTPVRGLMVLMLLFVIVIGPVNLLVLSRMKRRIWLLWTVPAVSLLTCAAVTLYAAVAEGWSGRLRISGLTILDQTTHRATTIGWAAFYSPVTPRGGLRFGYDTELTPQVGQSHRYSYSSWDESGRARDVDWTNDQHLASGWVTARVPAHFMVRKSETRRERLTVSKAEDGSPIIVNGLGAPVASLWFADENGAIYFKEDIPAGAQVTLARAESSVAPSGSVDDLRRAFSQDWLRSLETFKAHPHSVLMPGCYIAVLDDTPFIEQGLRKAKYKECRSVIYGIVGKAPMGIGTGDED